MIIN
jgi:hypothetical protein